MRRIYLVLFILIIIASFVSGYLLGSSGEADTRDQLTDVIAERDTLTAKLIVSEARADSAHEVAKEHIVKAATADSTVKVLEKSKVAMAKHYEKKIADVKRYTVPQIDSFLTDRYTYRPSFNTKLRPIEMPEWRAALIAVDLVKFDSVSAIALKLDSINNAQEVAIAERDTTIAAQNTVIAQKDTANSILVRRERTHAKESFIWKGVAKKYKRQRNTVIVGAAIFVAGKIAYSLLKR